MKKIYTILFTAFISSQLSAQTFARWDFDYGADASTSTGTMLPSLGTGTLSLIGGTTSTYVSGYPNSANDNTGFNTSTYAAQGTGDLTRGIQFDVSTASKTGIIISFAQYQSNTSSKYTLMQYTTDGTTWNTVDLDAVNTAGSTGTIDYTNNMFVADAGGTWYIRVVDLTGITAVNNAANFGFRILAAFDPATGNSYTPVNSGSTYGTSGTIRYDIVQVGNNSTLPIRLSYFTASLTKDNKVNLLWQTGTETGIDRFVIERSTNGGEFTNISTVEASGKEAGDAYSYIDDWTYDGPTYYRLRIVGQDNSAEYSPVVKIDIKAVKSDRFVLFPNPVLSTVNVRFSKLESGDILIYDFTGRVVASEHMNGNESSKIIDVSMLQQGTYIVGFYNDYGTTTQRFVKM